MKTVFPVKSCLLYKVLPTVQAVFSSSSIFKAICINGNCEGQNSIGVCQPNWAGICSILLEGYKSRHDPSLLSGKHTDLRIYIKTLFTQHSMTCLDLIKK